MLIVHYSILLVDFIYLKRNLLFFTLSLNCLLCPPPFPLLYPKVLLLLKLPILLRIVGLTNLDYHTLFETSGYAPRGLFFWEGILIFWGG